MGPALDILLLGLGLGSNMDFCGDFGPALRKQRCGGSEHHFHECCRGSGVRSVALGNSRCNKQAIIHVGNFDHFPLPRFPDMPGIAPS